MPPKKVTAPTAEEAEFMAVCLKHCKQSLLKGDFDFKAVAAQTKCKDEKAAYMKFYNIKNKWGIPGVKKDTTKTPSTSKGKKRDSGGDVKDDDVPAGSPDSTTPAVGSEEEVDGEE